MPGHFTTPLALFAIVGLSLGCSKHGGAGEEEFYDEQLATLQTALAARDVAGVAVNCIAASKHDIPSVIKLRNLCSLEAPILYLEESIADATKNAATFGPEMKDMACMQLFAKDAFDAIADHPPTDPRLTKLVDQYTKLCPAEVAKIKAKQRR